MIPYQKNAIIKQRETGQTYSAIAKEYNLSVNTVQSICRRAAKANEEKTAPKPRCENCHKPMKPTVQTARRFCCDECRYHWWAKHSEQRPVKEGICTQCEQPFSYQGSRSRKFCSRECYGKSKINTGKE